MLELSSTEGVILLGRKVLGSTIVDVLSLARSSGWPWDQLDVSLFQAQVDKGFTLSAKKFELVLFVSSNSCKSACITCLQHVMHICDRYGKFSGWGGGRGWEW